MRPSEVLRVYCVVSFLIGTVLSIPLAMLVHGNELSKNSSAILTLCLNTLLLMILPLILDWSERKYFKARFLQLEDLAESNPQLKAVLDAQCEKLSLPGLRLAAVDSAMTESFSYGLWGHNPRLVVPSSWLQSDAESGSRLSSIEVELNRFAKRDVSFVFVGFCVLQIALQFVLWTYVFV